MTSGAEKNTRGYVTAHYDKATGKITYTPIKRAHGGALETTGDNRVKGHLVRFTPPGDTDLVDERFDRKRTDFLFDRGYDLVGKPIKIEHGFDDKIGVVPVGVFDLYSVDDVGVWVEGKLKDEEDYQDMLRSIGVRKGITLTEEQIVEGGRIAFLAVKRFFTECNPHWSSGAFAPGVIVDSDKTIVQWPIDEGSGTVSPAEPDGTEITATLKSDNPALKALFDLLAVERGSAPVEPQRTEKQERATPSHKTTQRGKGMDTTNTADTDTSTKQDDAYGALRSKVAELMEILETMSGGPLGDEAGKAAKDAMEEEIKADLPDEEKPDMKAFMARLESKERDILKVGIAAAQAAKNASISAKAARYQNLMNDAKSAPGKSKVGAYSSDSDDEDSDEDSSSNGGGFRNKNVNVNKGVKDTPWLRAMNNSLCSRGRSPLPGMKAVKAQNPYIGSLGGDLVGQELATQILEPLRPKVIAFNAGIKQTITSGIGVYTVPRMTTAPGAYRPGINQAVTADTGKFDAVTAFLRPVAAQVDIPRQLLATTPTNAESTIRDNMIKSIRLLIDKEVFIGTGVVEGSNTGASIRGILNTLEGDAALSVSNVVTLNSPDGRQPNYDDLIDAETAIFDQDVEESETWGWVMNPRIRGTFRSLTDTDGRPLLFDNYGQQPYKDLIGYRVWTSTQIPRNITAGANTDTSYIFLGDFQYGEYVMGNDIEIIVDEVSQAGNLMIRITAYTFSDFILHYPQAFYVAKGVRR